VEKVGNLDYRIQVGGKTKLFHANMLKKYVPRQETQDETVNVAGGILETVCIAVIDTREDGDIDDMTDHMEDDVSTPPCQGKETVQDVKVSDSLTEQQEREVRDLLEEFSGVLTELPGCTPLAEHDIRTTTNEPVRVKQYPLPFSMTESIKDEVKEMLRMKVIEPSDSDYTSPVILVKKRDGTNRFVIDFRHLNRVSVFDAEPIPNIEEVFSKLAGHKYYSKFDLSKGYWQVPMSMDAKKKTAFSTPSGLFHFRKMPFGLVNAPATFSRLMRKLLANMDNIDNFIDDIIIFTRTWKEHMNVLRELLTRLRKARLTARPTKCFVGFESLECLGHMIGNQRLLPHPDKVDAVGKAPRPETKRQVKSFLGLAGFYRKFIPNFSAIAAPLSDLTKKGLANKVRWTDAQEIAFLTLKKCLTSKPILKLPDVHGKFVLRTDASDRGVGAVLLQEEDGQTLPVAYASRKLLPREQVLSTIEKECLAVVWAVQKFQRYVYGKEFVIETDHQPLTYLNRTKVANAKLMRWALTLQPFRYTIRAIKGSDNVGADYLSRV
jgi:hypothetical protein